MSGEEIDDTVEYKGTTKDGRDIWFVISIMLTYRDGKRDGALVMAHDITERKISERAIRRANKQLSLLNEVTRHDMRDQLTVLAGYA